MKNLKSLEKRVLPAQVPSSDDPVVELRRLVKDHKALTKRATAIRAMVSDKIAKKDDPKREIKAGDLIKSDVPEDAQQEAFLLADSFKERASKLESAMLRQLKQVPIYQEFLSEVFGCGPVVSAYLVAEINIHMAVKPSNLRRYAGMAVIDGVLERRQKGQKSRYNAELRTRLYQMFASLWKCAAERTKDGQIVKEAKTSKYLKIWTDYKHRMVNSERVVDGKIRKLDVKNTQVSAKGFAHSTGWHKAADVFLTDLYMVWRALEGLPVWCPYVAEKLGYWHGSDTPAWQGGKILTLEEAKGLVGDVGAVRPIAAE